jgi:hypothetical protein
MFFYIVIQNLSVDINTFDRVNFIFKCLDPSRKMEPILLAQLYKKNQIYIWLNFRNLQCLSYILHWYKNSNQARYIRIQNI